MKMKRPHLVPLSTQVLALLRELEQITGDSELIFPGQRSGRPISDAAMGIGLRQFVGSSVHVPHGFARVFPR